MGNLLEAILAIMGLGSAFYTSAQLLDRPGPIELQDAHGSPEQSQAIHSPPDKLAA